jgi:hypothetical protein
MAADSKPNLQLAAAPIARLHHGSIYQTGQNNAANATKQQMELIGTAGGKRLKRKRRTHKTRRIKSRSKSRRTHKRKRSKKSKKSKKSKRSKRRRGGGDSSTIKPQTFSSTYFVSAGAVTPNQNSAAITKLFADSAANAEFDGKVGSKGGKRRGRSRKCRSCMKRQHGRKSRKKRGGVKWGCMS